MFHMSFSTKSCEHTESAECDDEAKDRNPGSAAETKGSYQHGCGQDYCHPNCCEINKKLPEAVKFVGPQATNPSVRPVSYLV